MAAEAVDSSKKIDLVTVLLGTIIVLLVAVLTAGIQLYGVTVKNGTQIENLQARIDKQEIPPEWLKQAVVRNSERLDALQDWATRHRVEYKALLNSNSTR